VYYSKISKKARKFTKANANEKQKANLYQTVTKEIKLKNLRLLRFERNLKEWKKVKIEIRDSPKFRKRSRKEIHIHFPTKNFQKF